MPLTQKFTALNQLIARSCFTGYVVSQLWRVQCTTASRTYFAKESRVPSLQILYGP